MKILKIEKADLFGHDWGPFMGWNLTGLDVDRFYTYFRFEISSHWPMLDEPKIFNKALIDFLNKNN
jgi:pimeloyl-ACP methyl ester carboxylesterase